MANDTIVTLRGWVGADPTVFKNTISPDGEVTARTTTILRLGVTPSYFNRMKGGYEDGTTAWYSIRTYGPLADNVGASIRKGTPIIVRGRLIQRNYTDKDGNDRSEQVVLADAVGVDLNTGTASFVKVSSSPVHAVAGERLGSTSEDEITQDPSSDNATDVYGTSDEGERVDDKKSEQNKSKDPAGKLASIVK